MTLVYLSILFISIPAAKASTPDNSQHLESASQFQLRLQKVTLDNYYLGEDLSRFAWLNMPSLFPHVTIPNHKARPLDIKLNVDIRDWEISALMPTSTPATFSTDEPHSSQQTFDQYVKSDTRINSVLIIKDGDIVYQQYNSHGPEQRHIIWSVTKVMTAAVLAQLESKGHVEIHRTVSHYLPELKNSVWDKVKVQHAVDMASGVDCIDGTINQKGQDCNETFETVFELLSKSGDKPSSLNELLNSVTTKTAPGLITEYASVNTLVVGKIIEAITNQPLHLTLSESLWKPMGAEADALIIHNSAGDIFSSGGISARLTDVARFGLLYLKSESKWSIMPETHLTDLKLIGDAEFPERRVTGFDRLFNGDLPSHSKWQWDLIWSDGDLYKDGFSGQGLYISPARNMVMVWFGTADKEFKKHYLLPIARQLATADFMQTGTGK